MSLAFFMMMAAWGFIEYVSFVDVIRAPITLGGDSNTLAVITGGLGWARSVFTGYRDMIE